jgi:transcriptional regulator with XRE-family HTH domain
MFAKRLKELRKSKVHLTQTDMAKLLGVAKTTYASYEQGKRTPDTAIQNQIADYFDVSLDYLHGRTDRKHYYDLTPKDEKEITVELEKMINDLSDGGALAFSKDDSELSKETRELLIASLENSLRIAKIEAKKRYTPKKYRD